MNLQRFVDAQAPVLDAVVSELASGVKRSHWMWFVFPQLAPLGRSATARHYGLASIGEARAYLAHPLLGERLRACTRAVLAHPESDLRHIFGSPDDLKFRSCMTLFSIAAPGESLFHQALAQFCDGRRDPLTVAHCEAAGEGARAGGS